MPPVPDPARPRVGRARVSPRSSPPVTGAVLCGGQSSRFGRDKALVDAGGQLLGARVIMALRQAGIDPVVAVGGTAGPALGVPTVPDRQPGQGPLPALATALRWAKHGLVVVVPCDLPLLNANHVLALVEQARSQPGTAVVASDGRPQPSVGCWPASLARSVQALIDTGARTWRAALEAGPWTEVPLPPEAMADADTPAELDRLLRVNLDG